MGGGLQTRWKGPSALKYLSRYLYRGVIGETISSPIEMATSPLNTRKPYRATRYRTAKGEDFLWLVLQHVLPKKPSPGQRLWLFACNAKKLLSLVQLVFQVLIQAASRRARPAFKCPICQRRCKSALSAARRCHQHNRLNRLAPDINSIIGALAYPYVIAASFILPLYWQSDLARPQKSTCPLRAPTICLSKKKFAYISSPPKSRRARQLQDKIVDRFALTIYPYSL